MAIRTLCLDREWDYESKHDPARGTPEATVFTLGVLSARLLSWVMDNQLTWSQKGEDEESAEMRMLANTASYEVVRYGLRGARNLQDSEGNDVQLRHVKKHVAGQDVQAVGDDVLRTLPIDLVRELAEQIRDKSGLSEEQAKNSDG